ncbi:XRE family transcriptional regulator [Microbacterium sp. KUDC0406]|uniref:helix-turn-helix domain-containing protein n=1 Tax=Microbacterium sp. KUDC0406 TaxID=2909588 RepID=UPI001F1A7E3D|nr:XRE family transcriptional regulator [Microbacterium sp. KUDC0406]UJP09769.1 XRE family transcriptional regulator [Microbacterium sp. KUDC0406]
MGTTSTSSGPAVADLLEGIGDTVRSLRKKKKLTLAELADATGLSPAIISQLERGLANPSFTTLAQLAHGLDIPVGRLLPSHQSTKSPVVRREERRDLRGATPEGMGSAVYELLVPDLNGALEAHWVVSGPGHDTSATPFTHGGEEFGLIISGQKEVCVDGELFLLNAGDSIRFDSTKPHWFRNTSSEQCVAVWVNTPPTW